MKSKSIIHFLLETVKNRIDSISYEIFLVDKQLQYVGFVPGTDIEDRNQLTLQRNIQATLHDLLVEYHESMQKFLSDSVPMKMAISCHLYSIKQQKFQILLQELFGQQSALTTLVGPDYQKYTRDVDVPADIHLKMIALVFPYEFIIDLLSSAEFFQSLLLEVMSYQTKNHVKCVSKVFNMIRRFENLKSFQKSFHFFTANNPMYFALAEHFVTCFTHKIMIKEFCNPIKNYADYEKCRFITLKGISQFGIKKDIVEKLQSVTIPVSSNDGKNLREFKQNDAPFEYENDIIEFPSLYHISLELRKMPLQPSPSRMLYIMSNAHHWLSATISFNGKMVGADEIFIMFLYCLCYARLFNLPEIVSFIERFIDDALMETKFQYLITQLKSCLRYIEEAVYETHGYVCLPFKQIPNGYKMTNTEKVVILHRFTVFAFPTYVEESKKVFPCYISYTGNANDTATVWVFKTNEIPFDSCCESFSSIDGQLFVVKNNYIDNMKMIKIDRGNYEESTDDLELFSSMMMMSNAIIKTRSLSKLDPLYETVKKEWHFAESDTKSIIRSKIAEIQKAIVIINDSVHDLTVDGILNDRTLRSIREIFKIDYDRRITPFLFDTLMHMSQK